MAWLFQEAFESWIYWAVAGWFAVLGSVLLLRSLWFDRRATARADGVVIELHDELDSDGGPLFRPVVCFQVSGEAFQIEDVLAANPAPHRIGDRVDVYFPPGHPAQAQIGRGQFLFPFTLLAVLGWGMLAAGFLWRLQ
jgi:hypothetical protein